MNQCNEDKLLSHFIELENEIQTIYEPDYLTWSAVREAQQRLSFITRKLNNIHNSKLAVNRVASDILYNIFTVAIYESTRPWRTALNVSHVSCHWRKSALGWPSLWGYLDFDASVAILDLFTSRSENAPLTFSISTPHRDLSKFLQSRAELILPRLRFLNLNLSWSGVFTIGNHFQKFQLQPLQLQCLNITSFPSGLTKSRPFTLNMDVSCLRELRLHEMSLPWLELPGNRLTHCTLWYPVKPPTLPQLLVFLFSCPFLSTLMLGITGLVDVGLEAPSMVNTLFLPNLKELILTSRGSSISSYEYIHEFAARIQTPKSLSQFNLCYYDFKRDEPVPDRYELGEDSDSDKSDPEDLGLSLPFSVFESVPPAIFSHCASHRYLYIAVDLFKGSFLILSGPEYTPDHQGYPLKLVGSCQYDNFPILELIRAMPQITWLTLCFQAWELIFRNIDMASAFPCLDILELDAPSIHRLYGRWRMKRLRRNTLELQWPHWTCPIISSDSLPQVKLKIKTLFLSDPLLEPLGAAVADAVLVIGAKVVKLGSYCYNDHMNSEVIDALRQKGVVVVPVNERNNLHRHMSRGE